ncbi:hypothetical protein [Acinetobacter kyonggiensis]|uniref:hypothetical protein n=1 Tax=Acinetobacter kyonggiensis TaxID=595670 RepID=UPI0011150512|nr:hypothetical protein [Acinetobacter kyonggiensis]
MEIVKKKILVDEIEIPSSTPRINFISEEKIKNKKYIFLSIKYSENYRDFKNRVNYSGEYNLINVYECKDSCKINNELSNYFGSGGDVFDLNNSKIVYKFPYGELKSIQDEIKSKLFNQWLNNGIDRGVVLKKTNINDIDNYTPDRIGYLVKGDIFKVKKISSRWLNITYTNKNGRITTGWISCKDTNVCN